MVCGKPCSQECLLSAPAGSNALLREARLKRTEAESALRRAEAKATRARAEADVSSTFARSEAETALRRAEAEANRARAEADVSSTTASMRLRTSRALACAGVCGALGVNWYLHESADGIMRAVSARLRRGGVPDSARGPANNHLLPIAQSPLSLAFLPVMLVSPTGAGKSTLLASFARREAEPLPRPSALVVLLRFRAPTSSDAGERKGLLATAAAGSGQPALKDETLERLGATAAQVYKQIGFPQRRAVLRDMLDAVSAVRFGDVALDLRTRRERDRLAGALRTLFEASELLFHERLGAGMSRCDAAPILLFDEVHDLIRDDRLAAAGGRYLFQELATLLVAYVVDRQAVRAAVAGSSALLSVEFDRTVAAGARWEYYTLRDPADHVTRDALLAAGYSAADASAMMNLCGARMRLLSKPLRLGPSHLGSAEFCEAARQLATAHFADLFRAASVADARIFASTLDAALRSERMPKSAPSPSLSRSFSEAHAEAASRVLYVQLDRTLAFQSRLHACVWREVRSRYT